MPCLQFIKGRQQIKGGWAFLHDSLIENVAFTLLCRYWTIPMTYLWCKVGSSKIYNLVLTL